MKLMKKSSKDTLIEEIKRTMNEVVLQILLEDTKLMRKPFKDTLIKEIEQIMNEFVLQKSALESDDSELEIDQNEVEVDQRMLFSNH